MTLPIVGEVALPPIEHLAWYAAVAVLAVAEVVDWPIAALLALGKALTDNRHNKLLQNVGEALEEAG